MESKQEWSIKELTETLNKTAATDKDNLVVTDGGTGTGKSTLSIKACKKGCSWFNMNRDVLYSREEVMDWINNSRPGSWGVADEMINVLFKREFAAKQQKFLLKVLDMCRNRNLTLFMCIPNFWSLDKHILEGRVRLRVHVARTGLAFMWKPSNNPFAPDRWYRKYNEKVCHNWDNIPNARRTKGFVGFLRFGDLQDRERERYEEIKIRKKEEVKNQEEALDNRDEEWKQKSYNQGITLAIKWFETNGYLNKMGWLKKLATYLDISPHGLRARIRRCEIPLIVTEHPKEDIIINYNNSDKKDKIPPNKAQFQHSAI